MLKLNVEQGSDDWFLARAGIPTASNFDKIFTGKGDKSKSATGYMNTLLAEWVTKKKSSIKSSEWMQRGVELEPEARSSYEFIKDIEVEETGIVYRDEDKLVSCSPDGLMPKKGLEIKCPSPGVHVSYLLSQMLPAAYVQQVQGSMWVTGLTEWDFMSYHPDMKPVIITIKRDERLMAAIDEIIPDFIETMLSQREKLNLIGI